MAKLALAFAPCGTAQKTTQRTVDRINEARDNDPTAWDYIGHFLAKELTSNPRTGRRTRLTRLQAAVLGYEDVFPYVSKRDN